MSWWNPFKKKKEIVIEEQNIEEVVETNLGDIIGKCTHCGKMMYSEQKLKKLGLDRYHQYCLRKLMKGWKRDLRNGTLGKQ